MQVGDLVKMKYTVWWRNRKTPEHLRFIDEIGIVLERSENAVKVLLESGKIKSTLWDQWEVINDE